VVGAEPSNPQGAKTDAALVIVFVFASAIAKYLKIDENQALNKR